MRQPLARRTRVQPTWFWGKRPVGLQRWQPPRGHCAWRSSSLLRIPPPSRRSRPCKEQTSKPARPPAPAPPPTLTPLAAITQDGGQAPIPNSLTLPPPTGRTFRTDTPGQWPERSPTLDAELLRVGWQGSKSHGLTREMRINPSRRPTAQTGWTPASAWPALTSGTPSLGSGRHPGICADSWWVRRSEGFQAGEVEGEKAAETELRGSPHLAAEHCRGQRACPTGCVKIHLELIFTNWEISLKNPVFWLLRKNKNSCTRACVLTGQQLPRAPVQPPRYPDPDPVAFGRKDLSLYEGWNTAPLEPEHNPVSAPEGGWIEPAFGPAGSGLGGGGQGTGGGSPELCSPAGPRWSGWSWCPGRCWCSWLTGRPSATAGSPPYSCPGSGLGQWWGPAGCHGTKTAGHSVSSQSWGDTQRKSLDDTGLVARLGCVLSASPHPAHHHSHGFPGGSPQGGRRVIWGLCSLIPLPHPIPTAATTTEAPEYLRS